MISDAWIATGFLIILSVISIYFYMNNIYSLKRFKDGKPIASVTSFKVIYLIIMLVTMVVSPLCFFYDSFYLFEWHNSQGLLYSGLSLASIGMGLFIMAKLNLGDNYNPCFKAYVPNDIIKNGIYKYIRHPIYTANVVILIGAFVAAGSWLLLANIAVTIYAYLLASKNEELALTKEFPEYLDYIKRTGAFLPKVAKAPKQRPSPGAPMAPSITISNEKNNSTESKM